MTIVEVPPIDADWPSQVFRNHVANRLNDEIVQHEDNYQGPPLPGDGKAVEEYIFQKCTSKDEYMSTIAKFINAIRCSSGYDSSEGSEGEELTEDEEVGPEYGF